MPLAARIRSAAGEKRALEATIAVRQPKAMASMLPR